MAAIITGGTGNYGCVIKEHETSDGMVLRCTTFADAKSFAVQIANEYVQHLKHNFGVSTGFLPGQHPSTDTPAVRVISTDRETWYQIEILVDAIFEDGTPNRLLNRIYQVGWLAS